MNVLIITSSYPAHPQDPTGAAGLFVREFALELLRQGHNVVVQPVARKNHYQADPGLVIEPLPWRGGDQELASMGFLNPKNALIFLNFFLEGRRKALDTAKKHRIDRVLCMWVVPSGIFGYWIKKTRGVTYDVWALGSDIWKIRKIPFIGNWMLRLVIGDADGVWADGLKLADDVKAISGKECRFLPSSRRLPPFQPGLKDLEPRDRIHFLYVGRYHPNKGPDLLLEAVRRLPPEYKKKLTIHMFGTGPMEHILQNMIRDYQLNDVVRFNGPIEAKEFSAYLQRVAYLVIPSRIESIPIVFFDALQLDRPVVAMPVGDLKRLIDTMSCGIIAAKADDQALAEAIMTAVDTNPKIFQSNIAANKKQFDVSNTVGLWIK